MDARVVVAHHGVVVAPRILDGIFELLQRRLQFLEALVHVLLALGEFLQTIERLQLLALLGILRRRGLTLGFITILRLLQVELIQLPLCLLADREQQARRPVVIFAPATLCVQWQTEMLDKLGIPCARWDTVRKVWLDDQERAVSPTGREHIARCPLRIGIVAVSSVVIGFCSGSGTVRVAGLRS